MPTTASGSRPRPKAPSAARKKSAKTSASCRPLLLVFGYVAVFVGAFLIFNTFSITVTQRVAEFGVLRTLGASRRQILASVVLEALAIGLLGAIARHRGRLRRRRSG